ncbi:nineteen complex-related protein 2-domain-containing protein [Cladochytrium replicatum]|nr:nineteen complex-related protein 2-domain-containing protein [Cladochytrium replicatum]
MFNRRKKGPRRVNGDDGEGSAAMEVDVPTGGATASPKTATKKITKTAKTTLSFAGDLESEETFTPVKKKISKSLAPPPLPIPADAPTHQGSYSQEELDRLRNAHKSRQPGSTAMKIDYSIVGDDANDGAEFVIPDADAVFAARKLREQKRVQLEREALYGDGEDEGRGSEDFVSLESRSLIRTQDDDKPRANESRLVDEDQEEEGEEPFEDHAGDRVLFGSAAVKHAEQQRTEKVRADLLNYQEEEIEDDEVKQWEMDQLRKGGVVNPEKALPNRSSKKGSNVAAQVRPARRVPAPRPLPVLQDVVSNLTSAMMKARVRRDDESAYVTMAANRVAELKADVASLQTEISDTKSQRYEFYARLWRYVNDYGSFLDAKFPELEFLEQRVIAHRRTYVQRAMQEREQRLVDRLRLFAANFAMPPVIPTRTIEDTTELDENEMEEEPPTIKDRHQQADAQLAAAHTMLVADVRDDLLSLSTAVGQIHSWKQSYPTDYNDAYGDNSVSGVVEFLVRYEMLNQNIFEVPVEFQAAQWHSVLLEYPYDPPAGITSSQNEDDQPVLLQTIFKVILPVVKRNLSSFNPYSENSHKCAVALLNQITEYVSKNAETVKGIIDGLVLMVDEAVANLVALNPCTFVTRWVPDNSQAVQAARSEWASMIVETIRGITLWNQYMERQKLDSHLSSLVNAVLLPMLRPSVRKSNISAGTAPSTSWDRDLMVYEQVVSALKGLILKASVIPSWSLLLKEYLMELRSVDGLSTLHMDQISNLIKIFS